MEEHPEEEGELEKFRQKVVAKYDFQNLSQLEEDGSEACEAATEPRHQLEDVEKNEEERVFEAFEHKRGVMLRVPKTDLEEAGFEPDEDREKGQIVELTMRDLSDEDERIRRFYARYEPDDNRAEVYLGREGVEAGDKFRLVEAKEVDEEWAVREFEEGKCRHLDNVKLTYEDEKLALNVDGEEVPFNEYSFSTNGSEVVLKGTITETNSELKFEFDGRRVTGRFGGSSVIEDMRVEDDELLVKYAQSKNEEHTCRLPLEYQDSVEQQTDLIEPKMLERAFLVHTPEGNEGEYRFEVDEELREYIEKKLEEAAEEGDDIFRKVKGDVGERLVTHLLEVGNWELVAEHKDISGKKGDGVSSNGPDRLFRTPQGELVKLEIKFWEDTRLASRRAREETEQQSADCFYEFHGERIRAAYTAVVDWNVTDRRGYFVVEKVELPGR